MATGGLRVQYNDDSNQQKETQGLPTPCFLHIVSTPVQEAIDEMLAQADVQDEAYWISIQKVSQNQKLCVHHT